MVDLASFWTRPDRLILAAIFAGALVGGWAILPGENERVAMLERDGHSREALAILEHQVSAGVTRYRSLHQILALYENEGNVAKAQEILEAMVRERPRDAALKRRQAQFYKHNQKDEAYLATLRELIELRYSESACRELIARLRLRGDAKAEQATLQSCRQKGYRRPDDLARLAELLAADGDTGQASGLLRSIDDLKRLKTPQERYQLLQLLIDQDQPNEAERRAVRWIKASRDDASALGYIDLLAQSAHPNVAIEVAKNTGFPGDTISLTVAERLLEKNQIGPALLYLRGWFDQAQTAASETAVRFVDAALAAGDPKLALAGARRFGFVMLPKTTLERVALTLDRLDAKAEADEIRAITSRSGKSEQRPPADDADARAAIAAAALASVSKSQTDNIPRARNFLLVDPLEGWRRSLHSTMTLDAQRRMQALFVGPKPSAYIGPAGRQPKLGNRGGDARNLLKKTSRIIQRNNRISLLTAKRGRVKQKLANPAAKPEPAGIKAPELP